MRYVSPLASPVPGLELTLCSAAADSVVAEVSHVDGLITVSVTTDQPVRITALIQASEAVALWRPGSARDHASIPASWEDAETVSPLSGVALGCLLTPGDRAAVTYGAQSGSQPVRVRTGLVEETTELLLSFETDGEGGEGTLRVFVDLARRGFVESVQSMTKRLGGSRPPPSVDDERPVLCTWYFMHQAIDSDALMGTAELAAELGFGTLIIDDGWQTVDTVRAYGSAGDWVLSPTKIGDAARLVQQFADCGMRTLWWIGTPFVGHRSEALKHLPIVFDEPAMEAAVLDTRSGTAREHLVGRVVTLLRETGAHGVKLDFLERFAAPSAPRGVEAGALKLLDDLIVALDACAAGVSLEFREPYIGPASTARATMLRVSDCPMSPIRNRLGIIDLRLATTGVAIHADPIMWAKGDSSARVAQHLINALFGVPQISVDLRALSETHAQVLAFWLGFVNRHREVLLHGEFRPERPELHYPVVHASAGATTITARYSPCSLSEPAGDWSCWHIANADSPTIDLHTRQDSPSATRVRVTVRDPSGAVLAVETYDSLPTRLAVPTGGMASVERL